MRTLSPLLFTIALGLPAASLSAATINIGYVEFSSTASGVNAFSIYNLTGSFFLPPDFDVASSLNLANAVLTLTSGQVVQNIALGTLQPGPFTSAALEFSDSTIFTAATLNATLPASFLSSTGTFVLDSTQLSATFEPDVNTNPFAIFSVTGTYTTSAVPEPATAQLFGASLIIVVALAGLRRQESH
ncbi:MAG: hypothetical protein H7039_01805 [Bryobacteraceae bacterium]|nr:hypothetical protein [Bryobacteraceae bacterium]